MSSVINPNQKGAKGDTGATGATGSAATVSLGTVTTGSPGSNVVITNSGSSSAAVLNFTIPGTDVVQKARITTSAAGTVTWTYPTPYGSGVVPIIQALCEGPNPFGNTSKNVQIEGTPTNTSVTFRVVRSDITTVALLGLTILSIPASPGATVLHVIAYNP